MDGRKNNGGPGRGGGRKTKAEEMGLPKLIEDVIGKEGKKKVIQVLYKKATDGDVKALTLLMAYVFGKPSDQGVIDIPEEGVESVTINYHKPSGD